MVLRSHEIEVGMMETWMWVYLAGTIGCVLYVAGEAGFKGKDKGETLGPCFMALFLWPFILPVAIAYWVGEKLK